MNAALRLGPAVKIAPDHPRELLKIPQALVEQAVDDHGVNIQVVVDDAIAETGDRTKGQDVNPSALIPRERGRSNCAANSRADG